MKTSKKASTNTLPSQEVLSQEDALAISTIPSKVPKADKDILHDADSIKLMPEHDASHTIISNKRKRK